MVSVGNIVIYHATVFLNISFYHIFISVISFLFSSLYVFKLFKNFFQSLRFVKASPSSPSESFNRLMRFALVRSPLPTSPSRGGVRKHCCARRLCLWNLCLIICEEPLCQPPTVAAGEGQTLQVLPQIVHCYGYHDICIFGITQRSHAHTMCTHGKQR